MDEFIQKAFEFHQSRFQDLYDRRWDRCDCDMIKEKMDFIFSMCYGEKYIENQSLDKLTQKIRRKFLDVSKKNTEELRVFNCSFTYNQLVEGNSHWISPLFMTISTKSNTAILIDENCREYKSFDDFLQNNNFPKCFMTFPENGLYDGINFVKLYCAWSKACSTEKVIKKMVDVVSVIGSVGAAGVLMANPIGIPLIAANIGFLSTSVYSLFRGVENLVDVNNHCGGLSLTNGDTIINAADIALTAGGLVTLGASNVVKTFVTRGGKTIVEGSAVYRLVRSLEKSFKLMSVSGIAVFFVVFVKKFQDGDVTLRDFSTLSKYILFSMNCFVTVDQLRQLVKNIANLSVFDFFRDGVLKNNSNMYVLVKDAVRYVKSNDYLRLLDQLFPFRQTPIYMEVMSIKDKAMNVSSVVNELMAGHIDPATFVYRLSSCMEELYRQVINTIESKQEEITRLLNSDRWIDVCKWNRPNKIAGRYNTYENKLQMADTMERRLVSSSRLLGSREKREQCVFELVLSLVAHHNVTDDYEALQKLDFYCKVFAVEMKAQMEQYYFNEFKEVAAAVHAKKHASMRTEHKDEKLRLVAQNSFHQVMDKMFNDSELYHQKFLESRDPLLKEKNTNDINHHVYVFNWPLNGADREVDSKVHYEIANSFANLDVNDDNTIFNSYMENLAMLRIIDNNSLVVFCEEVVGDALKGVMIYVPTF